MYNSKETFIMKEDITFCLKELNLLQNNKIVIPSSVIIAILLVH